MKRIKENTTDEIIFDSLKPLYGSKGNTSSNPPYYDPNDLHSHVWKKGKLGIEDNPKIPTYSKSKMVVKDCTYCKICHTIKDSFQSTVGDNIDIVDDIIIIPQINVKSDYQIIANEEVTEKLTVILGNYDGNYDNNIPILEKLFHRKEGIVDDYLVIGD